MAKKKNSKNLDIIKKSREKERKEAIANGTWMKRGAVHKKATDYNRKSEKRKMMKEIEDSGSDRSGSFFFRNQTYFFC